MAGLASRSSTCKPNACFSTQTAANSELPKVWLCASLSMCQISFPWQPIYLRGEVKSWVNQISKAGRQLALGSTCIKWVIFEGAWKGVCEGKNGVKRNGWDRRKSLNRLPRFQYSPERKINNGFGNKKCMRRFIFDSWSVYDTENHGRFRSRIFLNSVKISKS